MCGDRYPVPVPAYAAPGDQSRPVEAGVQMRGEACPVPLPAPPPLGVQLEPVDVVRQMRGGIAAGVKGAGEKGANAEGKIVTEATAVISFSGPASVVSLFRMAISAWTGPSEPRWTGLARLLAHVVREWQRAPRHRDPVFRREGWRCLVPGCTSRRNLHDHHRQFRSRGGSNALDNRATVCAGHHLNGIHTGRIRVTGTAPDGLLWEIGVGALPGGRPLMRLRGNVYLP